MSIVYILICVGAKKMSIEYNRMFATFSFQVDENSKMLVTRKKEIMNHLSYVIQLTYI